jgi:hypothetical protein
MGAIVVLLVAVAIMLLCAVGVAVMRLATALRGLRDAVRSTQQWLEPVLAELNEGSQVASLEVAQLQASVADLRGAWSPGGLASQDENPPAKPRRPADSSGYTA